MMSASQVVGALRAEKAVVEAALREYAALNRWDAAASRIPRAEQGELDALLKLCDATQVETYELCRVLADLREQTKELSVDEKPGRESSNAEPAALRPTVQLGSTLPGTHARYYIGADTTPAGLAALRDVSNLIDDRNKAALLLSQLVSAEFVCRDHLGEADIFQDALNAAREYLHAKLGNDPSGRPSRG